MQIYPVHQQLGAASGRWGESHKYQVQLDLSKDFDRFSCTSVIASDDGLLRRNSAGNSRCHNALAGNQVSILANRNVRQWGSK